MEVYEALRTRRSAGAFASAPPPRALIERLIEAATWAPNHHLTEPWRFAVLTGDARAALARAIGEALLPDLDTPRERSAILAKLERAPVVIVVTQRGAGGDMGGATVAPGGDAVRSLEDYAACACATQNLLLAAHAEGLAAKWSTGKLARSPGAAAYLGLGEHDRIVAYVYVGYPLAHAEPRGPQRAPAAIAWHE